MKYSRAIRAWLSKSRKFKNEILWGITILIVPLLMIKIVSELVLKNTFLEFGTILKVLLLYLVIVFLVRLFEIIFKNKKTN